MRDRIVLWSVVGLMTACLAFAGCSKKEEKPKAPEKATDTKKVDTSAAKSATTAKPGGTSMARTETPPIPAKEAPVPTPAAAPKPAAGAEQKTAWYDVRVGDTLVYKMPNNMQMTYKVTKVDDKEATVAMTTKMAGADVNTTDQKFPRMTAPVAAEPAKMPEGTEVKDLGTETVKVGGVDLKCKVTQSTMKMGDKTITSKAWMCDQVPGGLVKTDTDAMGTMQTTMELTEFKKGG